MDMNNVPDWLWIALVGSGVVVVFLWTLLRIRRDRLDRLRQRANRELMEHADYVGYPTSDGMVDVIKHRFANKKDPMTEDDFYALCDTDHFMRNHNGYVYIIHLDHKQDINRG